jgi:hypothetical protein
MHANRWLLDLWAIDFARVRGYEGIVLICSCRAFPQVRALDQAKAR